MNNYWKAIGVAAVGVAILYYPAMKLYQYLAGKRADDSEERETHHMKAFLPAYRGKHNPHSRSAHDGQGNHDIA